MKYYIGIDGGGSKTIFAIADENGKIIGTTKAGSAFYKQIGEEKVIELLKKGIKEVCTYAQGETTQLAAICFGMPGWGESAENDKRMENRIRNEFSQYNFHIVNDCEVGWTGSLEGKPGINIVAGTGSIAFGRNEKGESARCGGWSQWFGDEGSGYWLGMKCVQLFSRQSDGRDERGPLYDIMRSKLQLFSDQQIIDLFEQEYLPERDKVAALQEILLSAAKEGDLCAIAAYEQAAKEFFDMAYSIKKQIFKEESCVVSCSGGIFKTGDIVCRPLKKMLEENGMKYVKTKKAPYEGAVLLAMTRESE